MNDILKVSSMHLHDPKGSLKKWSIIIVHFLFSPQAQMTGVCDQVEIVS